MRALVTGANGFVGRHLVDHLRRSGVFVRAAVRRADRRCDACESVAIGDIDETTDWHGALSAIDTVFHLAARVHVGDVAADRGALYQRVNVDATLRLAQSAAQAGVLRFVFVSTAKVMGQHSDTRPFAETDTPAPPDVYAASKWDAEQRLRTMSDRLEVAIVRPPLVYGPGVGAHFLRLLRAATSGWPLPLACADAARSLVYVGNLVDGLALCGTHPRAAGMTFFLADSEALSVAQLLTRLRSVSGDPPRLWSLPKSALALGSRIIGKHDEFIRLFEALQIDSTSIRSALGWCPPFSVDAGLRATLAWFESVRSPR